MISLVLLISVLATVRAQTCYDLSGLDESCLINGCNFGLYCNVNKICKAASKLNGVCDQMGDSRQCEKGLFCDGTACKAEAKAGEDCKNDYECQQAYNCDFSETATTLPGKCVLQGSVAAGKPANSQSLCDYGLILDTSTLDANGFYACKNAGDVACTTSTDCSSAYQSMFSCNSGRCAFLGEPSCKGKFKSWLQHNAGKDRNPGSYYAYNYDSTDDSLQCSFDKCIFAPYVAKGYNPKCGYYASSENSWSDVGGVCNDAIHQCKIGLECDISSKSCKALPKEVGAACINQESCAEGLYCDDSFACQKEKKNGETCKDSDECISSYCNLGECIPGASVASGEVVSNYQSGACEFPLIMVTVGIVSTCTEPSDVTCVTSNDCGSSFNRYYCCNSGKCEYNGNNCKSQYDNLNKVGYSDSYESDRCKYHACLDKDNIEKGTKVQCGSGSNLSVPISILITLVIAIIYAI